MRQLLLTPVVLLATSLLLAKAEPSASGKPDDLLRKPPASVHEVIGWLEAKSKAMIRASRRTMKNGIAAFPPQVGSGYEAFWLRDYAYMLEGNVEAFSDQELRDACLLFVTSTAPDGAGVDCPRDTYQNGGYWATPVGWFVYTLDLADPQLADQTLLNLVEDFQRRGVTEWVRGDRMAVQDYIASATMPLAGARAMLKRRKEKDSASQQVAWSAIPSPIIFEGDATTAYRDPAAVYHDGVFHLFFTLVKTEPGGKIFSYTAKSTSCDLVRWTPSKPFTPRDQRLNYCSPGDVIRLQAQWVLCLSSYPRPNDEKYGNHDARAWILRSNDLEHWSEPELLRVKGPEVPVEKMGRMIDPYLFEDKDEPGKWWCFYKQNGVSMSWSRDLKQWTYFGRADGGENSCILVDGDEYVLFHSPANGIGIKRSKDLKHWQDCGLMTLGQKDWPWARGRLTAGFVLGLRREPRIGKYILFFHGSGPEDERTMFDHHASLGIAWSDDLKAWHWPGEEGQKP